MKLNRSEAYCMMTDCLSGLNTDFHHAGFARFQLTESSKVVGHPLTLATVCSDGSEVQSEHYIVAEKYPDGSWSFAATLRPLEGEHAPAQE